MESEQKDQEIELKEEETKDKEEEPKKEEPKKSEKKYLSFSLKMSKLQIILISAAVVLVAAILLCWKFGVIKKAYDWVYRADVTITVLDSGTEKGLPATVAISNTKKSSYQATVTADANGQAKITRLIKGSYSVVVTYQGYYENNSDLTLTRGRDNKAELRMTQIPPEQATVTGKVVNYVSDAALADITVTIGAKSVKTDSAGLFSIAGLDVTTQKVTIVQKGYQNYSKDVEITELSTDLGNVGLVPLGKVVFISNRDGKNGIYTANYDGSDQKALVARVGEYEDVNPIVSSDNKKVVFLSNRAGVRDNGNLVQLLYVVDIDGKNLTKITDVKNPYNYAWIGGTKQILWQGTQDSKTNYWLYDIAGKTNTNVAPIDQNVRSSRLNDSADILAYTIQGSSSYQYTLYYTSLSAISPKLILADQTGLYVNQFKSGKIYFSYSDGGNNKNMIYTLADGTTAEGSYDYSYYDEYVKSNSGTLKATVSSRDGKSNVYTVNAAGKNEKKITSVDTASAPVTWSADDNYLLFNSHKSGESALYIVSANGGTAKKVVDVSYGYGY